MGFQGTFCTFLNLEAPGDCSSHYLGKRYINYLFPFLFHERKTQMSLEKLEGEKIMTDLFFVFFCFLVERTAPSEVGLHDYERIQIRERL